MRFVLKILAGKPNYVTALAQLTQYNSIVGTEGCILLFVSITSDDLNPRDCSRGELIIAPRKSDNRNFHC